MSTQLKPAVSSKDHVQGANNAPIELVEYGDYQCSYCGQAYPIVKAVQQAMGNNLKFVFRNFPLIEVHPNAQNAALAAEAAAMENKFWQMHDMLYENQAQLDPQDLASYAKKVGLNLTKFEKDYESGTASGKVESDFESGVRSGVNGTPSFFINGEKYEGDWSEDGLTQYLQSLLK